MQLADFLNANKLSDKAFADRLSGRPSEHAVKKWRYRERTPDAARMVEIAALTDGLVTVSDWAEPKHASSVEPEKAVA